MGKTSTQVQDNLTPEPEPKRSKAEQARLNGAKSKGPVTDEGKAIVSQNARKHGLGVKRLLVDKKHRDLYMHIEHGLYESLRPQSPAEFTLAEAIAQVAWKLKQAENIESDLLRDNIEQGDSIHSAFSHDAATLMQLSNYQARLSRRMHRLFDEFRKLHKASLDPIWNLRTLVSTPLPRRPNRGPQAQSAKA